MEGQYSMRSPAVKRLMREMAELKDATEDFYTQPIDDNLFEWHFTVRGPNESDFQEGIYHGRIILPLEYPMKPPSIILLTPNGRFELNKKICLSISGHHPESWRPSWSIRTALLAIIGFMPTHGNGAIGSLDYTPEERKVLAKKSEHWNCSSCGRVNKLLKNRTKGATKSDHANEAKELASQINFAGEEKKKKEDAVNNKVEEELDTVSEPIEESSESGQQGSITDEVDNSQQHWARTRGQNTTELRSGGSLISNEYALAIVVLSVAIAILLLRRIIVSCYQSLL